MLVTLGVALAGVFTVAAGSVFVLVNILGKVARPLGESMLFAGKRMRILAAGGPALDILLLADDAVEQIQILADEGLLVEDTHGIGLRSTTA